jgi:hypothetical protein
MIAENSTDNIGAVTPGSRYFRLAQGVHCHRGAICPKQEDIDAVNGVLEPNLGNQSDKLEFPLLIDDISYRSNLQSESLPEETGVATDGLELGIALGQSTVSNADLQNVMIIDELFEMNR